MFYRYKVQWYNSYTDEELSDEGIVLGDYYGAAACNVEASYGSDNIIDLYLKEICLDDSTDRCLSKEEIEYAFREECEN